MSSFTENINKLYKELDVLSDGIIADRLAEISEKNDVDPPIWEVTKTEDGLFKCKLTYTGYSVVETAKTEEAAKMMAASTMLKFIMTPDRLKKYCLNGNNITCVLSEKTVKNGKMNELNGPGKPGVNAKEDLNIPENNILAISKLNRNEFSGSYERPPSLVPAEIKSPESNTDVRPPSEEGGAISIEMNSDVPPSDDGESKSEKDNLVNGGPLSKKNGVKLSGGANPIGFLQEFTVRNGLPFPVYVCFDSTTSEFRIKCTLANKATVGSGMNKKSAKRSAAEEMVKQLFGETSSDSKGKTAAIHEKSSKLDEQSVGNGVHEADDLVSVSDLGKNYVGRLQEYAVKAKCAMPAYEDVAVMGKSHAPLFKMKCTFAGITHTACGRSKKETKNFAAMKVYNQIVKVVNPDKDNTESNEK